MKTWFKSLTLATVMFPVGLLQGEVEVSVLHGELGLVVPVALLLEFRIKIRVESPLVVEELLITEQRYIRPDRFEE